MAITEVNVRHIAKLANLALADAEVARITGELGVIVGYIEQLQAVDTAGVEPIAQVTGLVNVVRADTPRDMLPRGRVLGNAPKADEVAFLVPKAVDRS